ncbi:miniconductance mechanosensitive channel [Lampropedia hyalina DSM 16112]|uniref:Mechanosensing system component YbdG n=1 Tax=Lampropedia hyalina DSM 16112 TaxID=1122156 RepID=A0A1M5B4W3_9BURK|nr:mechanosensitive ion channel domain-containing protein [Lampropedia hyalina]SHF37367.1 miniconductance mechanosensitive channel [Lampropedia hyalina DSM 16112]
MNFLQDFFNDQSTAVQMAIGLALLLAAAFLTRFVLAVTWKRMMARLRERLDTRLTHTFLDDRILTRVTKITPSVVVQLGVGLVPHLPAGPLNAIGNIAFAFTTFHLVRTLTTTLNVVLEKSQHYDDTSAKFRSLKSTFQLINIMLYAGGVVVIIAALLDRSPLIVLSGMGAMSAVLMLVFKDTILSFTAGVLISSNDMLRVGDWIEMPQAGADGAVIDIALHTIKVQNWDKTITTIPTWKLVSESYKNWRGMQESGGRRIKRSIRIDAGTVRFLTPEEVQQFRQIALLRPYLDEKITAVRASNVQLQHSLGDLAELGANRRRLTNIGTFRAYALAYLKKHPGIHQDMLLMVRQMEPTPEGIPMELYCFTNTTIWAGYEGIQGDVFDHLLAILPELGLRTFQNPSGTDMRTALADLKAASQPQATASAAD